MTYALKTSIPGMATAAIAALLAGCATAPYAEITGYAGASPDLDVASTIIVGVDGHLLMEERDFWRISPGAHDVLVATTRQREKTIPTSGELELLAAPCTRYYIVARHASGLDVTDWVPEVARTEPIKGCKSTGASGD